jgi:hypothetical protein
MSSGAPTITSDEIGGGFAGTTDIEDPVSVYSLRMIGGATNFNNYETVPETDNFSATGANVSQPDLAQYPDCTGVKADSLHVANATQTPTYHCIHEGSEIEFICKAASGGARVWVNGKLAYLSAAPVPNTGNWARVRVVFGSRAVRRLAFEYAGAFYGAKIEPDATLVANPEHGPRIIHFGDSFTEGTGSSLNEVGGYAFTFGHLIGTDDVWIVGSGGTGFVNSNGARGPYISHIEDVNDWSPDIAVFQGSINDGGADEDYVTAVNAVYDSALTANPYVLLVAISPLVWSTAAAAMYSDRANTLRGLTEARGGIFLDTISAPMITGSGRVGAETGDGNADIMVSADGVHYTQAGHDYAARFLASQFISKVRNKA